jgi:hypothetical protein
MIDDVVSTLHGLPDIILEHASIQPGRTPDALRAFEVEHSVTLPSWVRNVYAEIGAAHISWRLSSRGYERLELAGIAENDYEVSGGIDILSPEEVVSGFTGQAWTKIYDDANLDYLPVDFASFVLNLGFISSQSPPESGPVLFGPYDHILAHLDIGFNEYIRQGAKYLFIKEWQYIFTDDAEYLGAQRRVKQLRKRLAG